MLKVVAPIVSTLGALALAGAAWASEGDVTTLRVVGDAPTIGEAAPRRFVIDAQAVESDVAIHREVTGWFVALPPLTGSGAVTGSCVRTHCDLSVDLESHELKLSGDLMGLSGSAGGKFEVDGDVADALKTKGDVAFSAFANTVPGLGDLVKADAISSQELDDLLLWAGIDPTFGGDEDHTISDFQHEHLANWQRDNSRPVTGLLFASDIAELVNQRAAHQKVVGWTRLGGPDRGWSAGYPAALLPKSSRAGAEQRFASADGAASLVIAIDPPLGDDQFDALVDKMIDHPPAGQISRNYARSGPDMEVSYVEGGKVVSGAYYNRKGGLARLVFTYPEGENPYADIDAVVSKSLRVTNALKPAP